MSNRILSYKGLMADGAQETILLSTRKGEIGYKLRKLTGIGNNPGTVDSEHVFKIYKVEQTTVDAVIDFSDNTLLATMYYTNRNDTLQSGMNIITFDQEIFNQDIYITHSEIIASGSTGTAGNYYLELEIMKLDESQAMVATLKDIRNTA